MKTPGLDRFSRDQKRMLVQLFVWGIFRMDEKRRLQCESFAANAPDEEIEKLFALSLKFFGDDPEMIKRALHCATLAYKK